MSERANITQQEQVEIVRLLRDKDIARLHGYQRHKEAGHYHYDTSGLLVGSHQSIRQYGNCLKYVNICHNDQFLYGKREYGCAGFVLKTAQIAADKLMRLRSNLSVWSAPPPYCGKGRPRSHGDKFKLNDSSTWSQPVESLELDEPQLGRVQISLWQNLHFRKAAGYPMSLLRVERLSQRTGKAIKPMWLAWVGQQMPPLAEVWQLYLRRFAVDQRQSLC